MKRYGRRDQSKNNTKKKEKTLETGTARGTLNAAFFSVLIANVPC